jgi:hypothetical protein
MRHWLLPFLMLAPAVGVAHAQADPAAAEACAAKLDPDARAIYVEAVPGIREGKDMRAVLTKVVMPKVMTGTMTKNTARPLAESASHCLALMQ